MSELRMEGEAMIVYDGYKALAANIFNQAIYDYKLYRKRRKNKKLCPLDRKSMLMKIQSIEKFLESDWADNLAEFIGFSYKPETLIKKLRRETK